MLNLFSLAVATRWSICSDCNLELDIVGFHNRLFLCRAVWQFNRFLQRYPFTVNQLLLNIGAGYAVK